MAKDKLTLPKPVVVEGKYDKIRLSNIIESPVILLGGFSAFNDPSVLQALKTLGKDGLFLLTDPDSAGTFIRGRLRTLLPGVELTDIYPPRRTGKDNRRNHISKEGVLGVESIDDSALRELLAPYACKREKRAPFLTPPRAYSYGISGGVNSSAFRNALCRKLGLPPTVSTGSLIRYINENLTEEVYASLVSELKNGK